MEEDECERRNGVNDTETEVGGSRLGRGTRGVEVASERAVERMDVARIASVASVAGKVKNSVASERAWRKW